MMGSIGMLRIKKTMTLVLELTGTLKIWSQPTIIKRETWNLRFKKSKLNVFYLMLSDFAITGKSAMIHRQCLTSVSIPRETSFTKDEHVCILVNL